MVLKERFRWWLGCLQERLGHRVEYIAFIERQRRGVLHVHAVICGVRTDDRLFFRAMVNTWERRRNGEHFGQADIKRFEQEKAGKLCLYLAKERCKDLMSGRTLEGNGHLAEVVWWSRGVKKRLAVLNENSIGNNAECNSRQIKTCNRPMSSLGECLVNSATPMTSSGLS